MDELFMVEKYVGEVAGIVSLQYSPEREIIEENDVVWEEFPPEPVVEIKAKPEGEEGEEEEEAPPEEDEGEAKAPKFEPKDYSWTVTDRKPKNLP